jgi:lysozyme family protein
MIERKRNKTLYHRAYNNSQNDGERGEPIEIQVRSLTKKHNNCSSIFTQTDLPVIFFTAFVKRV